MSGWLALVGGGEWTPGCTFDAQLLEVSGAQRVVVLPTASAYEGPAAVVAAASAWFGELGAEVVAANVFDRAGAADPAQIDVIANARFIYLASGSAMHLLSTLKRTALWEAIKTAHAGGACVAAAGTSAAVLCDAMVDPRGGGFGIGLGLVTQLTLIPRYDQWSVEKARRTIDLAPSGLALAGIPERTALLRDPSGTWSAVGVGEIRLFKDGHPADLASLNS